MSENGHKIVEIPESITIRDLAEIIETSPIDVIKQLMANGVMANINQLIDYETAAILVEEFGLEAEPLVSPDAEGSGDQVVIPGWRRLIGEEDPESLVERPPVVTILGHVDHGKTTLLDAIRETNVAGGEVGGITQHIGAYQVKHHDKLITFLDTPGHAAFTAMRARGAKGADIAVLVVAADDGVMPQTREALAHANAAGVPIIVALNKIDREQANPDRVKQQLADVGLVPDDWDGDTMIVPVSAKNKTGLADILEAILLVADSNEVEIKANPKGKILGTVIEAEVDKARGIMVTMLVQNGTLNTGDTVLAGTSHGKVKAMFDFLGKEIEESTPSTPISVLGLSSLPEPGELFTVVSSTKEARAIAAKREAAESIPEETRTVLTLDQVFEAFRAGDAQELRLVLKADVQGSLEPLVNSLTELGTDDLKVNVLHAATGNITKNDVMLASASNGIVVGFNVTVGPSGKKAAEEEKIDIRLYDIIYRLTEDIEKALKGMLPPEIRRVTIGKAQVQALFRIPKIGVIAGCRVLEGELRRNAQAVVMRGDEKIFEGAIGSLKHLKDDVKVVREGFECGVGLKGFSEVQEGDIIESFTEETVPVA